MKYDKGSFIVIPNKELLDGIDSHIQVVFLWICSYSDERGTCFPSRTTLARNAGCSVKTVDRAIESLCEVGFLKKIPRIEAGKNLTNLYQIMLIEPIGGVSQSLPSVRESLGVASQSPTELNLIITNIRRVVADATEVTEREIKPAKYPNARTVFNWFPNPQPSWKIDTTQCKHAELLFLRGESKVKSILSFVEKHKDEEYFPKITKPSDLERKWEDIKAYRV